MKNSPIRPAWPLPCSIRVRQPKLFQTLRIMKSCHGFRGRESHFSFVGFFLTLKTESHLLRLALELPARGLGPTSASWQPCLTTTGLLLLASFLSASPAPPAGRLAVPPLGAPLNRTGLKCRYLFGYLFPPRLAKLFQKGLFSIPKGFGQSPTSWRCLVIIRWIDRREEDRKEERCANN